MRLAVVGKDVSRSLSPQMHGFLLEKLHTGCIYDAVSIEPSQFSARAEELLDRYDGLNVTIPFKTEIIPFLRAVEGEAKTFGAVNTVLCAARTGYNTDGFGFALMLKNAGVEIENRSVLVLGAGGAGRSCVKKLLDGGAQVFVYERDGERLARVYSEIGGFVPLRQVPLRPFDLLLNCTGVGMHDTVGCLPAVRTEKGEEPLPEELFALCGGAADLIYEPPRSEFLRAAARKGKPVLSGESMLFYQAYGADCLFLGRLPDQSEALSLYKQYQNRGGAL